MTVMEYLKELGAYKDPDTGYIQFVIESVYDLGEELSDEDITTMKETYKKINNAST